jgi:hypothetical protein
MIRWWGNVERNVSRVKCPRIGRNARIDVLYGCSARRDTQEGTQLSNQITPVPLLCLPVHSLHLIGF